MHYNSGSRSRVLAFAGVISMTMVALAETVSRDELTGNLLEREPDPLLVPQLRDFFADLVFNYLAAIVLVILFESPGISLDKFFSRGPEATDATKSRRREERECGDQQISGSLHREVQALSLIPRWFA